MTVSQATLHDIEPLAALFDEYRVFYQKESDPESCKAFLCERIVHKDSVIFITRSSENAVMGFIQLYPLFSSTRMKKLWLLNDLYVNPQYRGLKVSVKLINRAKQLARDTDSAGLLLETAKSNTIGNALYAKTGFVLDTDHNYYSWD